MTRNARQLSPLYRRLPHGPSGLDRAQVERNQRTRICGAMIEAVACNGYHDTTVADVIALAGVSRRAFYELFANKEECFLATHDIVVAQQRARLLQAWATEHGWENRMHASLSTLLAGVARSPKGPRLVLVDSLGIGPRARERMHLAGLVFERLAVAAFGVAPCSHPQLTPRAVVAGVRHLAFNRLRDGRHRELATLAEDVLDWIGSYELPPGARLRALAPAPPAHLPPPTPASFLAGSEERSRVLGAVVHLTLDAGYAALSDAQIADFAGVSPESFRRRFGSKEECFLAVLDEFVAETIIAVSPAVERAPSWEGGVVSALGAFVEHLAARQALLRIAFVDLFGVGPAVIGQITRSVAELTELLTEGAPCPPRAPAIAPEAITGALWGVISTLVGNGLLTRLPALADHLAFIVLAPYLGGEAAAAAIAAGG